MKICAKTPLSSSACLASDGHMDENSFGQLHVGLTSKACEFLIDGDIESEFCLRLESDHGVCVHYADCNAETPVWLWRCPKDREGTLFRRNGDDNTLLHSTVEASLLLHSHAKLKYQIPY